VIAPAPMFTADRENEPKWIAQRQAADDIADA
jgi:hypothetical protein